MPNNTLELISGAYTGVLWETLEDVLTNEDSPAHIYDVVYYQCQGRQRPYSYRQRHCAFQKRV